jgi:hypothetical protein
MPRKPPERPVKPHTLDRREEKKQQNLNATRPVKGSRISRLDNLGVKPGK